MKESREWQEFKPGVVGLINSHNCFDCSQLAEQPLDHPKGRASRPGQPCSGRDFNTRQKVKRKKVRGDAQETGCWLNWEGEWQRREKASVNDGNDGGEEYASSESKQRMARMRDGALWLTLHHIQCVGG